jgi:predicted GIY-YIG superfamily endonuclease
MAVTPKWALEKRKWVVYLLHRHQTSNGCSGDAVQCRSRDKYIGITSRALATRFQNHTRNARTRACGLHARMRAAPLGWRITPQSEVRGTFEHAQVAEARLKRRVRTESAQPRLLNRSTLRCANEQNYKSVITKHSARLSRHPNGADLFWK